MPANASRLRAALNDRLTRAAASAERVARVAQFLELPFSDLWVGPVPDSVSQAVSRETLKRTAAPAAQNVRSEGERYRALLLSTARQLSTLAAELIAEANPPID